MAPAGQDEVGQIGLSPLGPMAHMVGVDEQAVLATREATTLVSLPKGPAQGGRDHPGPSPKVNRRAVGLIGHRPDGGVTGQAPGHLGGQGHPGSRSARRGPGRPARRRFGGWLPG